MDFIWNKITEWLKEIMIGGIMGNLHGLFDNVNQQVSGIAGQVGTTPQAWNSGVYSMIRSLSDNVILPIAGVILAIVMTLELLQLVLEKNNMQNFETWVFFKWIFKTFCAVLIVTNTWDIIMGIFDAAQSVVGSAAGLISADTAIEMTQVMGDLEARLREMEIGPLLGLWFQTLFVGVTLQALSICIFVIVYGRMVEIYVVTSLAPIPMATMMNHRLGSDGTELPSIAVCPGLSGIPHHRLRGDLRGAGAYHRGRNRRSGGYLDVHRLYGAAVLFPVQIRRRGKANFRGALIFNKDCFLCS